MPALLIDPVFVQGAIDCGDFAPAFFLQRFESGVWVTQVCLEAALTGICRFSSIAPPAQLMCWSDIWS